MNIKKSLLIAGVLSTLGATSVVGLASAATATSISPSDGLVQKIATKFNLNKDEVKAVFDQNRSDQEAARQTEVEATLTQAVTDGKITAAQKQAILDKRVALKTEHEANKGNMQNKTDAERKAAMDAKKAELEKWASDNGISTDYLQYVMGRGGRGHGGPAPARTN